MFQEVHFEKECSPDTGFSGLLRNYSRIPDDSVGVTQIDPLGVQAETTKMVEDLLQTEIAASNLLKATSGIKTCQRFAND